MRILTPHEWMVRCLFAHFKMSSRLDVFVIAHRNQNMPEGAEAARIDCAHYEGGGYLPPYVQAEFYAVFPWNRSFDLEENPQQLAAE